MEGSVSQFPAPVPAPKVPRKTTPSKEEKEHLNVPKEVQVSTSPVFTHLSETNKKPPVIKNESATIDNDKDQPKTKKSNEVTVAKPAPNEAMSKDLKDALAQTLQDDDIVIRTMKDDLDEVRASQQHKAAPLQKKQATSKVEPQTKRMVGLRTPLVLGPTLDGSNKKERENKPVALPPSKLDKKGKVVLAPLKKRRKRSHKGVWVGIVLLVGAIGVGAWWWIYAPDITAIIPGTSSVGQATANQILPNDYALIVGYNVSTEQDKGDLLALWSGKNTSAVSMTELMKGDPRLLLNKAEVNQFYYVLLENETRPYLVVPINRATTELLADKPDAETAEVEGWYVSHSMSVAPYLSALQAGNLASLSESPNETEGAQSPMKIMVGPQAAITLREQLLGSKLANGLLQEATLMGRSIVQGKAIELSGEGRLLQATQQNSLQTPQAQQNLLSVVPGDASFVRLGANFSSDLDAWSNVVGIIDTQFLEQPAVAALLRQLTTSYAYYQIPTGSGRSDFGTIVSLPPLLAGSLIVPDKTIEKGLSSLLTLLTGRKGVAPIEFSDNIYSNILLRYANFSQPTQALDYALTDQYLLIASSKTAMFNLLDIVVGTGSSVEMSNKWSGLLASWGAMPQGSDIILGQTGLSTMAGLLPASINGQVLIGLALTPDANVATRVEIKGVMMVSGSGTATKMIGNTQ